MPSAATKISSGQLRPKERAVSSGPDHFRASPMAYDFQNLRIAKLRAADWGGDQSISKVFSVEPWILRGP